MRTTIRVRAFWCVSAVLWAVCIFPPPASASPFLFAEVESALSARSEFLGRLGLTEVGFLSLWQTAAPRSEALAGGLAQLGEKNNPWYHYIRGLTGDNGKANDNYGLAVQAAADDAGALWLLGLDFIRHGELEWAASSLTALEKKIFTMGGVSAPFMSKQLMLLGNIMAEGSAEKAEFCYDWSRVFDTDQNWWIYKKGGIGFPANVVPVIPGFIAESMRVLSSSWRAQVSLVREVHRFFSAAVFIFICAVFLVFAVKRLPSGVHPIGDGLFGEASPRFRVFASVTIVVSTLLLGLMPAIWATAFLVCRFLNAAERKLLILVCALLALSPLNHYVSNFLSYPLDPASPASLLDRAVREGYSEGLHRQASANAARQPESYVNQLTLAVSAAKNRDYQQSANALKSACKLAPDDPLVLLNAGNISFLMGSNEGMEQFYGSLIAMDPDNAAARFNLSLAYVSAGGFTSSDMISEAAKIAPELVGGFMRENERYFSGDTPPLRKFIQTPVTPGYFWSHLFFCDPAEAIRTKVAHGVLGPLPLFGIYMLLFITLAAMHSTIWRPGNSRIRKYFACRICGRLVCKKCRKGTMCSACYRQCLESHNNAAAMYKLQNKYTMSAQISKDVQKFALGIVVPGAEKLYGEEPAAKSALVIFITSLIFAALYCAFTFRAGYPGGTVINPVYFVWPLLIYNLTAFVKQCVSLSKTLRFRAKAGK